MAITTARRAGFVVYRDEPQAPSKAASLTSTTRTHSRVTLFSASDKENLHPLTGRRPASENQSGKKRKTNALTTKLLIATGKVLAAPTSPKKRKLVSPTEGPVDKKEKREKRTINSRRLQRTNRVHKATDLPKLDEVVEEDGEEEMANDRLLVKITQAAVDARCYELTVLPLANLSKAYEQISPPEGYSVKESFPRFEFEDLPSNRDQRQPSSPDTEAEDADASSSSVLPQKGFSIFNTPERKRIYSAFTFESPSPASKRFASWRDTSVGSFPKIDFKPIARLAL